MRSPEQVVWDFVHEWLSRGDEDLHTATILIESGAASDAAIGFHCQQGAEKCLKAVLVRHQVDLHAERLTVHDFVRILRALEVHEPDLAKKVDAVQQLGPYAVQARYPGVESAPDLPDPSEALDIAQRSRGLVLQALGAYLDQGRPE